MNLFEVNNAPVLEALYNFNDKMDDVLSECYITDALLESCNNPDVLFEAGIGDKFKETKDKVVKFFKELWKKISDWFKDLLRKLTDAFNQNIRFVKTHEKEIYEKLIGKKMTNYKVYYTFLIMETCNKIVENMIVESLLGISVLKNEYNKDQSTLNNEELDYVLFNRALRNIDTGVKLPENYDLQSIADVKKYIYAHVVTKPTYVLTEKDVYDMKSNILNYNKIIRIVQKDYADIQKFIDQQIKNIDVTINDTKGYEHLMLSKRVNTYIINTVSQVPPIAINYLQLATTYYMSIFKKAVIPESK